ncbi:hypothetical protein E2C01_052633 [Portunus trituberculatus]|uniref:Uncharacterized protein n=1 Tax=Portunus trituberculatus TaxID=210409 RepID=A0A5B7GM18_PORTR|nr:hypothetical protein [Portunus trituberculatus]
MYHHHHHHTHSHVSTHPNIILGVTGGKDEVHPVVFLSTTFIPFSPRPRVRVRAGMYRRYHHTRPLLAPPPARSDTPHTQRAPHHRLPLLIPCCTPVGITHWLVASW